MSPPVFSACRPLVLASSSPRRQAFLRSLGLPFTVICPPEGVEPPLPAAVSFRPVSGTASLSPFPCHQAAEASRSSADLPVSVTDPAAFTLNAARAKLEAVPPLAENLLGPLRAATAAYIAADTIVVVDGTVLGKPADAGEALHMLRLLAGREHRVVTGCAVCCQGEERAFAVEAGVRFWAAPDAVLAAYAASGEPLDKAGGYAVQDSGAFLVETVHGSWSTVVGLPLAELIRVLLELGVIAPIEPEELLKV